MDHNGCIYYKQQIILIREIVNLLYYLWYKTFLEKNKYQYLGILGLVNAVKPWSVNLKKRIINNYKTFSN